MKSSWSLKSIPAPALHGFREEWDPTEILCESQMQTL